MYNFICILFQAYIQQLESSRIKLNQMEQELHHARNQVRKKEKYLHGNLKCNNRTCHDFLLFPF